MNPNESANALLASLLRTRSDRNETIAAVLTRLLRSVAESGPVSYDLARLADNDRAAVAALVDWVNSEPLPIATHPAQAV